MRIDRVTNQHVLNVTQRKHLAEIFLSKQLRVVRHWLRRPPETTIKKDALYTANQGRNRRGRPRATYVKLMKKVTGMNNHALICSREDWHTNSRLGKVRVRMPQISSNNLQFYFLPLIQETRISHFSSIYLSLATSTRNRRSLVALVVFSVSNKDFNLIMSFVKGDSVKIFLICVANKLAAYAPLFSASVSEVRGLFVTIIISLTARQLEPRYHFYKDKSNINLEMIHTLNFNDMHHCNTGSQPSSNHLHLSSLS